jgi:hypothetical protein
LDFVRERLALVGKTLFLVSFGFYLSYSAWFWSAAPFAKSYSVGGGVYDPIRRREAVCH